MKLSKACSYAALCIAAGAAPTWVLAQQASGNPGPPPRLENLEEGEPPAVTIKKPGEDTPPNSITETRQQGRVTEVKVQSGGSTYYLRPKTVGTAQPGDVQNGPPTNAQWKIKDFDWGGSKKKPPSDATDMAPGK
jgi:hypothetical protein